MFDVNLPYLRRRTSRRVYAIELTERQCTAVRVTHGHGLDRRDQRSFGQPRVTGSLFIKNLLARFAKDESGATAIEYGLIAAGISLAIIAVVNGIGGNLNTKFSSINTSLK